MADNKIVKVLMSIALTGLVSVLFLLPVQTGLGSISEDSTSRRGSSQGFFEDISSVAAQPNCSPAPVNIVHLDGGQRRPRVAYNGVGKYLVVWEDNRSGDFDIRGRFMAEKCPPSGGSLHMITISNDESDETLPDVVYNPDLREYFVIWHDERGVWGQRISDTTEQLVGSKEKFFTNISQVFTNSVVIYDSRNEKYIVATQEMKDTENNIIGRSITTTQLDSQSPRVPLSLEGEEYQLGDMAYDKEAATGLVVWTRLGGLDVSAQKFDKDGPIGPELTIGWAAGNQQEPTLDFNEKCKKYLIGWEDTRRGQKDIFLSNAFDTFPQPFAETPDQIEKEPDIAAGNPTAGTAEYLVAWQAENTEDKIDNIYARRVDCEGRLLGPENIRVSSNMFEDHSPAVAYLSYLEKYVVVWSGRTPGTGFDIYAQLIDTTSTGGSDNKPPRVVETSPRNEEMMAPIGAALIVEFSEPMNPSTVYLEINAAGVKIRITPSDPWDDNDTLATFPFSPDVSTAYEVKVHGQDKAGNEVETSERNPWSFTTTSFVYAFLPLLGSCSPLVDLKNEDFESSALLPWTKEEVGGHTVEVICVDDKFDYADFNKTCVVRLGNPALGSSDVKKKDVPNGHAAISQRVTIPCSGASTLTFDYHFCSHDIIEWKGKPRGQRDSLEIDLSGEIIDRIGFSHPEPHNEDNQPSGDKRCETSSKSISLSAYAGQTIDLRFTVWNREPNQVDQGNGYRNTWAYIDNIRIE